MALGDEKFTEGEGFEPPEGEQAPSTAFKAAPFVRSGTPPASHINYKTFFRINN